MKLTKEIEEFINLTITEHMGKEYAEWKIKQQSVTDPDKVEEEYEKVIASLSPEQEEKITQLAKENSEIKERLAEIMKKLDI